jgi:hypothetical protein
MSRITIKSRSGELVATRLPAVETEITPPLPRSKDATFFPPEVGNQLVIKAKQKRHIN